MSDHDKGFLDHVKDALGMGDDREPIDDSAVRTEYDLGYDRRPGDEPNEPIDMERGAGGDVHMHEGEPIGGVPGSTQASGPVGATGGMGASGAMGGAGAGGPIGDDPLTSSGRAGEPADAGAVRTEYEMGNEFDPEHERVAESGVLAERSGTAQNDTWRDDADDWEGAATPSRGEAASGQSPFDPDDGPRR